MWIVPSDPLRTIRSDRASSPPSHESTSQMIKKRMIPLSRPPYRTLSLSLSKDDLWPEAQSERGETHHSLHYPSVLLPAHTTTSVLYLNPHNHLRHMNLYVCIPPRRSGCGPGSLDGISRTSGQADWHVQELQSDLGAWYSISTVWWKYDRLSYSFLNQIRHLEDFTLLPLHSRNMVFIST